MFYTCFPATKYHKIITLILLSIEVLAIMSGIYSFNLLIEDPVSFLEKTAVTGLLYFLFIVAYIYFMHVVNNVYIEGI